MTVTSRLAEGPEPRFDLDSAFGHQGEMFVDRGIRGIQNGSVEVKTDRRWLQTGNIYVERQCFRGPKDRKDWHDSGLLTTTAETWAFVLGRLILFIPTWDLRAICDRYGTPQEEKDGSHPTRGVLLRVSQLVTTMQLRSRQEAS